MPLAKRLSGEACGACGEEELVYWTEDETESTVEAYMDCEHCRLQYSKVVIPRSEETSDAAVRERLVNRRL